jgi:cobalt-zinc-cadmium efflux system outer membrane protein
LTPFDGFGHFRLRWVVCALLPLLAAACGSVGDSPRLNETAAVAAAQATRAVAATEPIVFDSTGGSVDAGAPSPETLSLAEAVRRALATHPDIQAALSRVRAAQAEVDQAALFPNPVLSVSIRGAFEGKTAIEAGLAEDLVAFLTRPGRISAADSRLRAASAPAVSTTLDVLADVQQRYAAVLARDELMPVLEERRRLLARLLSLAESRLRRGEGTRLDVTTLNAQRVQLEVEVKEEQLARRQERLGLTRLIGQP